MEGIALLPTREDESSSTLTEATWDIVGYELFFSSFSLSSFFFDASSAFTLPPLIYFIIFLTIKFFFFFFFFLEIKVKCFNCSTTVEFFIFVKKNKKNIRLKFLVSCLYATISEKQIFHLIKMNVNLEFLPFL